MAQYHQVPRVIERERRRSRQYGNQELCSSQEFLFTWCLGAFVPEAMMWSYQGPPWHEPLSVEGKQCHWPRIIMHGILFVRSTVYRRNMEYIHRDYRCIKYSV